MAADSAGSYGAEVWGWAEQHLGLSLMPWQRHALEGQLAYNADGRLAHTVSLVSVARHSCGAFSRKPNHTAVPFFLTARHSPRLPFSSCIRKVVICRDSV